jgi:hypothetical protein
MKKNLVFGLVILSVFLVLSATFASTKAASYSQLGVQTGDRADYSLIQDHPYPVNMSNAARINFDTVTGTFVSLTLLTYYPNGTVSSTITRMGDVSMGANYTYLYVIAVNLTKDDPIFSGATFKINETIPLAVAGLQRLVNHLKVSVGFAHYDLYWDQATGLMVKANQHIVSNGGIWQNLTLTSTTVFSTSNVPASFDLVLVAAIGGVVGVLAMATVIVVRRRK